MKPYKIILSILILSMLLFLACDQVNNKNKMKAREEIISAEKEFAELASQQGVQYAFLTFASDSAVLNRGGKIIKGKDAIQQFFENQTLTDIQLSWAPDFVDVSKSCDMGYTFGKFNFSAIDTSGKEVKAEGVFHTVWKKQDDGSWRFVYD